MTSDDALANTGPAHEAPDPLKALKSAIRNIERGSGHHLMPTFWRWGDHDMNIP